MKRMLIALVAACALNWAVSAEDWNGTDWVYTPETHVTTQPVTAESASATVDSSFWSRAWSTCRLVFNGMFLIIM